VRHKGYLRPVSYAVRPLDLGWDVTKRTFVGRDVKKNCKLFEKRIQTFQTQAIRNGIAQVTIALELLQRETDGFFIKCQCVK